MRARRAIGHLRSRLAVRCLACVLLYAALIAVIMLVADSARSAVFDTSFPSMATVLEHRDALEQDRFDELSDTTLKRCHIIIFDGDGNKLYASSQKIAERIDPNNLPIINDYNQQTFYEVFQRSLGTQTGYVILRCTMQQDHAKNIQAFCMLDQDLAITGGTLFSDRSSLSRQEFDFLNGIYNAHLSVVRYGYTTQGGAARTLVLVAPRVNQEAYDGVVDESNRVWMYAAPFFGAATLGAAWLIVHEVKRATRPLDRAISMCKADEAPPGDAADIPSELAPVYDNFTDLMGQLQRARDDRQRLIADVSHDLKTPLTVIRGYARAFCDGRVPPDKQQAYHQAINDKAILATEMIDNLFAYAKMAHPEHRPRFEDVDLGERVRRIALGATPQVEQAACSIEIEVPRAPMPARLDAQLLRRMLTNLISNACAHNPSGTRILVRCETAAATCSLIVADDGVGFPPDIARRAFEPFVTENAARTVGGGTGLGLTIAKRCAELNGGTIRIAECPRAPWNTEVIVKMPLTSKGADSKEGGT